MGCLFLLTTRSRSATRSRAISRGDLGDPAAQSGTVDAVQGRGRKLAFRGYPSVLARSARDRLAERGRRSRCLQRPTLYVAERGRRVRSRECSSGSPWSTRRSASATPIAGTHAPQRPGRLLPDARRHDHGVHDRLAGPRATAGCGAPPHRLRAGPRAHRVVRVTLIGGVLLYGPSRRAQEQWGILAVDILAAVRLPSPSCPRPSCSAAGRSCCTWPVLFIILGNTSSRRRALAATALRAPFALSARGPHRARPSRRCGMLSYFPASQHAPPSPSRQLWRRRSSSRG